MIEANVYRGDACTVRTVDGRTTVVEPGDVIIRNEGAMFVAHRAAFDLLYPAPDLSVPHLPSDANTYPGCRHESLIKGD